MVENLGHDRPRPYVSQPMNSNHTSNSSELSVAGLAWMIIDPRGREQGIDFPSRRSAKTRHGN